MITTLYIIVSVIAYIFEFYPEHQIRQLQKETRRMPESLKRFSDIDEIVFCAATANMIVCAVILVLKCFGIISWW